MHEEYLPQNTTDFTAGIQRVVDKLKGPARPQGGDGDLGRRQSLAALAAQELSKRFGIDVATGGNILPAMASYKAFPAWKGHVLLLRHPKNPVNEALVAMHYKQFKAPPDFFTAGASPAMALVTALKATNGDTNTNKLIRTMEA